MVKGTENEVLAEIESIKESLSRVEKLVSAEGAGGFEKDAVDAATSRYPDAGGGLYTQTTGSQSRKRAEGKNKQHPLSRVDLFGE